MLLLRQRSISRACARYRRGVARAFATESGDLIPIGKGDDEVPAYPEIRIVGVRRPFFPGQSGALTFTTPEVRQALQTLWDAKTPYFGIFLIRDPPEELVTPVVDADWQPVKADDVVDPPKGEDPAAAETAESTPATAAEADADAAPAPKDADAKSPAGTAADGDAAATDDSAA